MSDRAATIGILGSGWLGLPLARHFLASGYRVRASSRSGQRAAELESIGAETFVVDIDALSEQVRAFLHADILVVNIPSKNVDGFRDLVGRIEASGIERVLFVSSTSVYRNVGRSISESDTDFYAPGPLLEIEAMFRHGQAFEATILRFGGLIGPGRHPGRFFKASSVMQDPDSPVNLIHRDDCIGIIDAIVTQQVWGEIFNACADTHPSKRDFYGRAIESIGGSLPTFGPTQPEVGKSIDNQKVKQLLNYRLRFPDLMAIELEDYR